MFRLLVLLAASLFVNMAALADDVGGALKMAPEKPLTSRDNTFVVAASATMRVVADCPGYVSPRGALLRYSNSLGVDFDLIFGAMVETGRVDTGLEYDRSMLIPEVTRLIHEIDGPLKEVSKSKPSFCKEWSDYLIKLGLIKKKRS